MTDPVSRVLSLFLDYLNERRYLRRRADAWGVAIGLLETNVSIKERTDAAVSRTVAKFGTI